MTIIPSDIKEPSNKCSEYDCDEPYTHVVYWPGKNPPPKYCHKHAHKTVEILNLRGYPVGWRKIGGMTITSSDIGKK